MTRLDRLLQRWRIAKATPFLPKRPRVLDIGSADGALFRQVEGLAPGCIGIDPTLPHDVDEKNYRLIAGEFPRDLPEMPPFDAITMLAVLEHFPEAAYPALIEGCHAFLRSGGRLIVTVPSPAVDYVLKVLLALRLAHAMSIEEHHGYDVSETREIFGPPGFRLLHYGRFQLGLNHLFVFERRSGKEAAEP